MKKPLLYIFTVIGLIATLLLAIILVMKSIEFFSSASNRNQPALRASARYLKAAKTNFTYMRPSVKRVSLTMPQKTVVDRKIIRNAQVTLEVGNIRDTVSRVSQLSAQYRGYVIQSSVSAARNQANATLAYLSLRVPSQHFAAVISALNRMAVRVINQRIYRQDITAQYVDLQSRLSNLQTSLVQYNRIMAQAKSASDVLKVYKEVSRVQGQIDRLKGQMKYYNQATSTALIKLNLVLTPPQKKQLSYQWALGATAKNALASLVMGAKVAAQFCVRFFLYYLPALIFLTLIAWLFYWLVRRLMLFLRGL